MNKIFKWFSDNKSNVLRSVFLLPILLSIMVSINHVIVWYQIGNPMSWAIFLSIAVEVAALCSLIALIFGKNGYHIYILFFVVTVIQLIGNIFFTYHFIDENGLLFKSWHELINVLMGETINPTKIKVWLAVIEGACAPLLSLLSLHLIVKFEVKEEKIEYTPQEEEEIEDEKKKIEVNEEISEEKEKELKEVFNNRKNILPFIKPNQSKKIVPKN